LEILGDEHQIYLEKKKIFFIYFKKKKKSKVQQTNSGYGNNWHIWISNISKCPSYTGKIIWSSTSYKKKEFVLIHLKSLLTTPGLSHGKSRCGRIKNLKSKQCM
jgi:hypothetical protein